jgi:plasmid stabilization system protein ParE
MKMLIIEEAQMDIRESSLWYENQTKGLGKQFLKSFRLSLKSIQNTPYGFVKRFGDFRGIPMDKFPYLIYYQIDKKEKLILAFAVLHTSMNPTNFQVRVK